jgi:hypothetical protein
MGLFSAHRSGATSKQRAIALTAPAAEQLLAPGVIDAKGAEFDCICLYGTNPHREPRLINKGGKNWRIGGRQISGRDFGNLDSKDFALIRSVRHNDGRSPILLTFVGRRMQRLIHAGLVATIAKSLRQSVAVFNEGTEDFDILAPLFVSVPAGLAVQRSAGERQQQTFA